MQRGVSFGIDELEQSVRRTRIDVALAGLDVQTVDRVEERLPLKKWKRGNRFAELSELAGGTVFEEVEAEADRRFARLVRREGERDYQRADVQVTAVGEQRGEEVPVEEEGCPMQRSATETVGLIGVEPRGEQLVDDFCGLEGKRKGRTIRSEVAGVMKRKQSVGSTVIFTVRTFVMRLNIF